MAWLLVFIGGGLGALARYGLTLFLPRGVGSFPWATLMANLIGALIIGLLAAALMNRAPMRGFWIIGVLGGFTTFSAFSLETIQLMEQRELGLALAYVGLSVGGGVAMCWLGLRFSGHA